jgi:hypothetical protein
VLAAARLVDSLDVQGLTIRAVNDTILAEGSPWRPAEGVEFLTPAGSLTYDLGADMPIEAAYVQANSLEPFSLQVSDDGTAFREIWAIPSAPLDSAGMRSRYATFSGIRARYVRFGESTGPAPRTVSEVLVYCEIPLAWPPRPAVAPPEPAAKPVPRPWNQPTRRTVNTYKMELAVLGAALLAWGYVLKRRGTPRRWGRLRDALLLLLGVLGYTGYYNWGAYHFPRRLHYHEFCHYYVGAKYFPELGYTGLYECANLAEAEQGFRRRVELRRIRDLRRNELVSARYVIADSARCMQGFVRSFTPRRWEEFKSDLAYFRAKMGIVAWEKFLMDHGYNPSPVWNMTGSTLANLGPASDRFIEGQLAWADPAFVLTAVGFMVWAFGWRVACVAALFFGTNEPGLYLWTGGAFLRQDWFFWAVAGVCLLKKGHYALGGAGIAVSTLLRVFPVGFFAALGMRLLWILWKERRVDAAGVRIVAGAALAVLLLVPVSTVVSGGSKAWAEFVRNTAKHADTPLTNYMGLKTVTGFRWETRQKVTFDPTLADPFRNFRETHRRSFRGIGGPVFLTLVAAYLALLFAIARREREWWVLATFGFGVITIGMELTCYYYSFLTTAAFLWLRNEEIPIGLLLLAAATQMIEFGTFYYDIRYTMESAAVVTFVVWTTWIYARKSAGAPPPAIA